MEKSAPHRGQRPGMRYVATIGNFDGVHLGHRHLIEVVRQQARERGLASAVFTFSNNPSSVLRPESAKPALMSVEHKIDSLRREGIARVVALEFTHDMARLSSVEFVERLHSDYGVDVLVTGFNHRFGHDGGKALDSGVPDGVELVRADEYNGPQAPVSSTIIRQLIAQGDMAAAAAKLGRRFSLAGLVVHGKQLGRTIGFPTANISIDDGLMLPPTGAYAAIVTIDGGQKAWPAMVGVVDSTSFDTKQPGIEVHILNLDDDLYGHTVNVEFVRQIRGQIMMSGVEQLQHQLQLDRIEAIKALYDAEPQLSNILDNL